MTSARVNEPDSTPEGAGLAPCSAEISSRRVCWETDLSGETPSGVCSSLKWSWAICSICLRSVVAGAFAERRRPSTETEALLPRSSASLLEDRLNQAEVCNLSISLYFLSWDARLAAIRASRRSATPRVGARGAGVPLEEGAGKRGAPDRPESASG